MDKNQRICLPHMIEKNENGKKEKIEVFLLRRGNFPQGLYYFEPEEQNGGVLSIYRVFSDDLKREFYEIEFTNLDFVKEIGIDESMFKEKYSLDHIGKSMNRNEKVFLYNFVQKILPKKILEYSCHKGHSTTIISKALIDSGIVPDFFETHEIDPGFAAEADHTLYDNDIDFVKINVGDVFDTIDREKIKEADFILVDSDHSGEFTERYVKEFFPLIKSGCWIAVHDFNLSPHYLSPEAEVVVKYIHDNNIDSYFHISDLLKTFKMTVDYSEFQHCSRNTLMFFRK